MLGRVHPRSRNGLDGVSGEDGQRLGRDDAPVSTPSSTKWTVAAASAAPAASTSSSGWGPEVR
jgi:hypothetical protein